MSGKHGMGMQILMELYDRDNGYCQICFRSADIRDANVDHIIPVSKGGTDDLDNLQLTHIWCNSKKSNKVGKVELNAYWREVPSKRELKRIDYEFSQKVGAR